MCPFQWQQLPFLVTVLILVPNPLSAMPLTRRQIIYAEALLVLKRAVGSSQQLTGLVVRQPCVGERTGARCGQKSKLLTIISLLPMKSAICSQKGVFSLHSCDSRTKSGKARQAATFGGGLSVPTLTPQPPHAGKPKKQKFVAVIASGVGAAVLVAVVVAVVYICLMRVRRLSRRATESGSSGPPHVENETGRQSPHGVVLYSFEAHNVRQLTYTELEYATFDFNQSNVIGEGGFGLVYKGLLQDGSMVAIKRRVQDLSLSFVREVEKLGNLHHRHIVKLVGYCQERRQQFLVYNYELNGSVRNHLYDSEGLPVGKLDMRQRLSIALGAAKGLEYLHGLVPPYIHMHFKTSNVLVDGNYVAKVADAGLAKLLIGGQQAGSSLGIDCFLDPELSMSNGFSERSDIYGFGVFLLELISGREAGHREITDPSQDLVEQAKTARDLNGFLDKTIPEQAKDPLQQMMKLALQCVGTGAGRPTMNNVVTELELIQENEIGYQQQTGEEIGVVTLGSELFQ
ncbi:probable serine/threonine-protein kinase PBL28 [Aristolochia californica]|uniref:probable serine/threonine-protein kinase PBL28 n=1 Tax=Aristolochia californica TaxID=171875 RepID=UPI0035E04F1F